MTDSPEFDSELHRTALAQLDRVATRLALDSDIHERLRFPRRALVVSVPIRMDRGDTEVFIGYRVHHNTALGPTKGGLRYDLGVKLAIVQADVYQAFLDRAAGGNAEASTIIRPLRVILPLYNTEIHYIVRSDSPFNSLHDIETARINGGVLGSGAALITHTLYRMMFNKPIPEANASYLSNEEALVKLIGDKTVDVVVVAAGQPAPLIANMKPEAQKFVKLLKFDPAHPSSKLPLTVYSYSTVNASSYPSLLKESFTTISVGAFLVTYDFNLDFTKNHLTRFARSLCQNFATLQAKGHPKWREVNLSLPTLGPGWTYYPPTTREIRACMGRTGARSLVKPAKPCSAEERILGFCS